MKVDRSLWSIRRAIQTNPTSRSSAVIENANRIAQAADVDADASDVIREGLVTQVCKTAFLEGSFTDRCTAPADRIDFDRVSVDDWPNAEVRID